MKYSSEIVIDLPRERVIELFDNPDHLLKWQPGLQSFEHLSGTPGQPGARSRLVFDMNGRRIEMIETVTVRNLPDEFSGTYETGGVFNIVRNFFYGDGPERTRWVSENEFQFSGYMRLLAPLLGGSLRKQSVSFQQDFKRFAEGEGPNPAP